MDTNDITTRCCIAGGGPAGIMLGYLLARAGIQTTVIEKWHDFFRDFRGDTIHPSTMDILHELGLLDKFLKLTHNETYQLTAEIGTKKVIIADFTKLKVRCPFIAFIPQWDFLNFLVNEARTFPHFQLLMSTEATDLIYEKDKIIGLHAKMNGKEMKIFAELIIGADGRHSIIRNKSGLREEVLGAPMDVLWFRLSRHTSDPAQSMGKVDLGKILIMIDRDKYWQCGYLIRKGDLDKVHQLGLSSFRDSIAQVQPFLSDRLDEIQSWEQVKWLEVRVDRLHKWYRLGLLCIGDAAHAMSPLGGVGINLAIQDAVASANILIPRFLSNTLTEIDLAKIQKRRQLPTRMIQRIQVFIQDRIISRVLGVPVHPQLPFIFKLFQQFPILQRIPAYMIGLGFKREHIKPYDE